MDAIRNFASGNRSMIINVIYIIAFLTAVYYLYKFYAAGNELDVDLLTDRVSAKNNPKMLPITDLSNPKIRIRTGGEYTISMWLYIASWDPNMPKPVFTIRDDGLSSNALMIGVLYPNETKMMIRAYTGPKSAGSVDYTQMGANGAYANLLKTGSNGELMNPSANIPQCDVQDVDLQRWIHLTVSVNGRIMDIYMDGKLARSCILPDIPRASDTGNQFMEIAPNGGFYGHVSGVHFSGYAMTPDRIYATYQAGPYSSGSFLTYIGEKFGFKLAYTGASGQKSYLTPSASGAASSIGGFFM